MLIGSISRANAEKMLIFKTYLMSTKLLLVALAVINVVIAASAKKRDVGYCIKDKLTSSTRKGRRAAISRRRGVPF